MTQLLHRLDENTSLPFKVILPLMVAIVSATIWIQNTLTRIETTQREHITRVEVVNFRNQLADQNRNLNVPQITLK